MACFIISAYSSGRSRPRFRTDSDMTCQWMSRSRTFAASSTHRLVSHAHGHSGTNQNSTRAVVGALCTASVMSLLLARPWGGRIGRSGSVGAKSDRGPLVPMVHPPGQTQRAAPDGSPSFRDKLAGVAVPNLTRVDAAARADLLEVESYDLQIDVTDGAGRPGEGTFRSTTTVRFACRRPGAATFIDLIAERVLSATLNGTQLEPGGYTEEGGLPLPGLAAENTLVVVADCR